MKIITIVCLILIAGNTIAKGTVPKSDEEILKERLDLETLDKKLCILSNEGITVTSIPDLSQTEFVACLETRNKGNESVNLEYATKILNNNVPIPNSNQDKNRFDKIYSFSDAQIKNPDNVYLNSAVYHQLKLDQGKITYDHQAPPDAGKPLEGKFVVTNAPMVNDKADDLSIETNVVALAKKGGKEDMLYFVKEDASKCKDTVFNSFSRDAGKKETVGDYYFTVLKNKIKYGVMLTNFIETPRDNGNVLCKVKADMYFPLENDKPIKYKASSGAEIEVTLTKFTKHTEPIPNEAENFGSDIRVLSIKLVSGGDPFTFTHYHYRHWGDFGVPVDVLDNSSTATPKPALNGKKYRTYLKNLAKHIATAKKGNDSVIAHCTGGVGRTGTFLHMVLINELSQKSLQEFKTAKVDLAQLILSTRKYRNFLVEADSQVELLAEYYKELATAGTKKVLKSKSNKLKK